MVRKYLFVGLLCLLFHHSHSRSMMTTRMVQEPLYPLYNALKPGEIIKFSDANQDLTVIKDPVFGACFINKHDPYWLPGKADKEYFTQNFDCEKVDESISFDELSSDAGPTIATMCRDVFIFKVFADQPPPPPLFGMKPPEKTCKYSRELSPPQVIDTSNNSGSPQGTNFDNNNSQANIDQNGSYQQVNVDPLLNTPNNLMPPTLNPDQNRKINIGDQAPPMNNGDMVPPLKIVDQAPPMNIVDQAPPMNIVDQAPPMNNGDHSPPLKNGDQAPPMNNGDQAPPMNNGDQSPPMITGDQAPPLKNGDQAPLMNNGDPAPPLKDSDQTQPLVNIWRNELLSSYLKSPFSYKDYELLPFLLNSNSGVAKPLSWRMAEEIQSSSEAPVPPLLGNWRELWSQGITFAPPKPNIRSPPMPLALRSLLLKYK